jgi:proline iminopeptidase
MSVTSTQFNIPIRTPLGVFKAWAVTYGNPDLPRILLIQGGPGTTHDYLISTAQSLAEQGYSVTMFGSIGTDYSDKAASYDFCDFDWFINELNQVVDHLKASSSNLKLIGHSWGGYLCIEYVLRYPNKISQLIISNAVSSIKEYNRYCAEVIIPSYPSDKWEEVNDIIDSKNFTDPKLNELLWEIHYPVHVYRHPVPEWPDHVMRTFTTPNIEMYLPACGPIPTQIVGWLAEWNRTDDIQNIEIPSLFISSEFDTNTPDHIKWMASQAQNGQYLHCPNSGHFAHLDDKDIWEKSVIGFFNSY